jgi:hypothetical protein
MLRPSSPDARYARFSGARLMLLSLVLALISATSSGRQYPSPEEARAIAKDAVIYGFPLVDNYRIQYSYFVDRNSPDYKAPWNTVNNVARVFTPEDTAIQTGSIGRNPQHWMDVGSSRRSNASARRMRLRQSQVASPFQ